MAHNISANNGAGSVSPVAIEGYAPSRESRNVIHDLLDGSLGVAYIAPRPRSGTLRMLFRDRTEAFFAYNLHAEETSFLLTSDLTEIGMTYVLDGSIDMDLDAKTGLWWVSVGYQEVG